MSLEITHRHEWLSTAPQACPEDMAVVAQLGFKAVMNNRPDFEGGEQQPRSVDVAVAAKAQGLAFFDLPFAPSAVDAALVQAFARMIAVAPKPILVYCRSGARSNAIFQQALSLGLLNPADLSVQDGGFLDN